MSTPRIRFLIGGVQKAGTTALSSYLSRHPELCLPTAKEAHIFDAPGFDEQWSAAQIDARHGGDFPDDRDHVMHGDATPITVLHPRLIGRVARYNPAMRWIILLRDPAARALSQYYMERGRGDEHWPLWPALVLEGWRLRGHADDFRDGSPLRHHSYRLRGDYARQLDTLHACFPREQVLLLKSSDLRSKPGETIAEVCKFLQVAPLPLMDEYPPVFEGTYPRPGPGSWQEHALHWLLRRERQALQDRYGIRFDGCDVAMATDCAEQPVPPHRA